MSTGGRLYVLLIGVNEYASRAVQPLKFAVADVLAVRELLSQRMDLDDDRCLMLTSPARPGAEVPRRPEVLRTLDKFSKAPMGPEDTFLLYFAGHGFSLGEGTYLLTADSEPASELLLRDTAISLEILRDYTRHLSAGQQLVILDACRNDARALARSVESDALNAAMARDIRALAKDDRARADVGGHRRQLRSVISACWEGQRSYEYPVAGHGWFCYHLLGYLREFQGGELAVTDLSEAVGERMHSSAWRELPEAEAQRPYVEVHGQPVRLRFKHVGAVPLGAHPQTSEVSKTSEVYVRHGKPDLRVGTVPLRSPASDSVAAPSGAIATEQRSRPSQREQVEAVKSPWTNALGIRFHLIRRGAFVFGASPGDGSARADELPRLKMAIEQDLWAAEFPLTVAVVRRFLDSLSVDCDPAEDALRRDRSFASQCRGTVAADGLPAVDLSLADAEVLCAWMHSLDGRRYRLPTEAEWEYMARAGTSGSSWWATGAGSRPVGSDRDPSAAEAGPAKPLGPCPPAVFAGDGPRPADPSRANPWGLIDVLGNVWEWTSSAYGPIAPGTVMSAGGVLSGEARTVRGGSWRSRSPAELRVSARLSMCKRTRAGDLGVRLICDVEERSQ